MRRLTAVLIAVFMTAAFAQNVIVNPQGIVVNPKPSFEVEVWLDKGGREPVYEIGEQIEISVRTNKDAYVYLFNIRSNGQIVQILPNNLDDSGRSNRLRAGETKTFPPRNANYIFEIDRPAGLDKVFAVASERELSTDTLVDFTRNESLFTSDIGEGGFASAMSIIVRPLPQESWVTDSTSFWVGRRPSEPQTGTLRIESSPRDAAAYIDGNFIGYTPVSYTAPGGRYDLELSLSGYDTWRDTVSIRNGRDQSVHANLRASRRTGTASFRSSPSGADVYVNGTFLGRTPLNNQELDAGSWSARFELDGYESATVDFTVREGSSRRVEAELRSRSGSLRIEANVGGADVYLNGRHRGTIPAGSGRLDLRDVAPGTYELTVIAPGYSTHVSNVRVDSGRRADVRVRQSGL